MLDMTLKCYMKKHNYKGVESWLGTDYSELPHSNIESGELKVGPQDFVIIPELYGNTLEQPNEYALY